MTTDPLRVIEVAWLSLSTLGVGIHAGAWWEAWRDWRRQKVGTPEDPSMVVASMQHGYASVRLAMGLINTCLATLVVLAVVQPLVSGAVGVALLFVTSTTILSSIVELLTRAAVLDAITVERLKITDEKTAAGFGAVIDLTTAIKEAVDTNIQKTEQAASAAHEAYKEANHINSKISDLQEQLLQTKKDVEVNEAEKDAT